VVGFPARAAAVLVDNDLRRLPTLCLPDGLFHLCSPGTNGLWYRVEASPDLLTWEAVCTNVVSEDTIRFVDPDAPSLPVRFYRILPEDPPPAE
jgi:hypothetical protein